MISPMSLPLYSLRKIAIAFSTKTSVSNVVIGVAADAKLCADEPLISYYKSRFIVLLGILPMIIA